MKITKKIHFKTGRNSRKVIEEGVEPDQVVHEGRTPRVSKLMALAIRFDQLLADGEVRDQAELARVGYVTRARVTQIMSLLNLAPDVQEELLFLPRTVQGHDPIRERQLRPICAELSWRKQREMWGLVKP